MIKKSSFLKDWVDLVSPISLVNRASLKSLRRLESFWGRDVFSFLLLLPLAFFSLQCSSNESVQSVSAPYAEEVEDLGEADEASLAAELGEEEEGLAEGSGDLPEGEMAMEEGAEGLVGGDLAEDDSFAGDSVAGAENDGLGIESSDKVASSDSSSGSDSDFDSISSSATSTSQEGVAQRAKISVKKIKSAPFYRAGVWANAVYILRPGDTLRRVSQKIYGQDQDRSKGLLAINPHLKSTTKAGNKVYYNSPYRPMDREKLLFYYEDKGMGPSIYVTRPQDNIRKVSKKLLGFSGAWKEIWATNLQVESKWEVASGVELRYWAGDSSSSGGAGMPLASAPSLPPPAVRGGHGGRSGYVPKEASSVPSLEEEALAGSPSSTASESSMQESLANLAQKREDTFGDHREKGNLPSVFSQPIDLERGGAAQEGQKNPRQGSSAVGGEVGFFGDQKNVLLFGVGSAIVLLGLALVIVRKKRLQQDQMAQVFRDSHTG